MAAASPRWSPGLQCAQQARHILAPANSPAGLGRARAVAFPRDSSAPNHGVRSSGANRQRSRGRCHASARAQREDVATVEEIADLVESILALKDRVASEYRAIGPEMRYRVDRLHERVTVLQESADRAMSGGRRIPTQLTANLIALQREHGSLENIVRLAMEAAPAITNLEAAVSKPSMLSDEASSLISEESEPNSSVFQSLVRESSLEPARRPAPEYRMSAPAAKGSSPFAAFRAEIERRVMEQLSGKKMDSPVRGPAAVTAPLASSPPASAQSQTETQARNEALTSTGTSNIEVPAALQLEREISESSKSDNGQPSDLSAAEVAGKVASLEDKLKQLEGELAKSLPLHVFEQKVSKINISLSEARAQVVHLTDEVRNKEAMLETVRNDMLAEKDQLMDKIRELNRDLEKTFSVEDLENAVNFGLEEVEKELEQEQDRAFLLHLELQRKEKYLAEQQERWNVMKADMETQIKAEQDRAFNLALELDGKEKLIMEQTEEWKAQKLGLESDLRNVQVKFLDVKKKRTKERAQLAEKKQRVKMLEQELSRLQESMEEADKIRLKKKEATYATVRMLIAQMVQSSREKAKSMEHASTLGQEVAKLQEENEALELTRRAAEEKAGLAEAQAEDAKSSLTSVGREVDSLQGELPSGYKGAALEKFFTMMGQLIKREAESMAELPAEDTNLSENGLAETEDGQLPVNEDVGEAELSEDEWDQDEEEEMTQPVSMQGGMGGTQ